MGRPSFGASGIGVLAGGLLLASCGPQISETRTVSYPAREASCSLEFVQIDNMTAYTLYTDGKWQVIGQIILSEGGIADPFSERYRAIVRPRACAMGGEAVAILVAGTNQTVVSSGSMTSYAVLHHPPPPGQAAPPKTF
jgi:hypothetical protein